MVKIKSETHELTKNISANSGIADGKNFGSEKEFQDWLVNWLEGKKLYRAGYKVDKDGQVKKEIADITKVEKEPQRSSGFGDIAVNHNHLDFSYTHALPSPFIIECKNSRSFRDAVEQAIRYKSDSGTKYQKKNGYKMIQTGIVTPQSLKTGEIAKKYGAENPYPINRESKRIYWKLGTGVIQSIVPDEIVISFCEQSMAVIK